MTGRAHSLRDESSNDRDVEYITGIVAQPEMVHAITQEHNYPKVIYTEMFVDTKEVKFQVDSGAPVNVIPVKFVADKKLKPSMKTLQMWNDTPKGNTDVTRGPTSSLGEDCHRHLYP